MGNHKYSNNRRDFLKKLAGGGCASLSLVPLLSGITNLGLINSATAASAPKHSTNYKALVCIMLSGGNDSFNMLAPIDDVGYQQYLTARSSDIALDRTDQLLPINPLNANDHNYQFGLHYKLPKITGLFNGTNTTNGERYASFVANVGTLLDGNFTKTDYENKVNVPYQLCSHSDQIEAWQTGILQGRSKTFHIENDSNQGYSYLYNVCLNWGANYYWTRGSNDGEQFMAEIGTDGGAKHFFRLYSESSPDESKVVNVMLRSDDPSYKPKFRFHYYNIYQCLFWSGY